MFDDMIIGKFECPSCKKAIGVTIAQIDKDSIKCPSCGGKIPLKDGKQTK